MHYEIQAKLTIMLRDVAPTYGLGSAAMRELLAVYVCCVTFMGRRIWVSRCVKVPGSSAPVFTIVNDGDTGALEPVCPSMPK